MDMERYDQLEAAAKRLVAIVGTTPFIELLFRQAEVEEAILSLRDLAEGKGIAIPEDLDKELMFD